MGLIWMRREVKMEDERPRNRAVIFLRYYGLHFKLSF